MTDKRKFKAGTRCILVLTSTKNGQAKMSSRHISIASALRKARDFSLPYKLFTLEGRLLRSGWLVS